MRSSCWGRNLTIRTELVALRAGLLQKVGVEGVKGGAFILSIENFNLYLRNELHTTGLLQKVAEGASSCILPIGECTRS